MRNAEQKDDPAWVSKYLADLWLMDRENWDTEGLVSVISVMDIDETTLNEMKQAGTNRQVLILMWFSGCLTRQGTSTHRKIGFLG